MTRFCISTGILSIDGVTIGPGYSGAKGHVDRPEDEPLQGLGPIPEGSWGIGQPVDSHHTGPFSMQLTPGAETKTYGRSGFEIHGDNSFGDHSASHGCIIAARLVRERINEDPDRLLVVVA